MWAKRLLPSSISRFVKKPNAEEKDAALLASGATGGEVVDVVPDVPSRPSTPRRRRDEAAGAKVEGEAETGRRAPPACPRAFKMITFRTPCNCEACDPFEELGLRRSAALPTFGRSPSGSPKALPTFGRSPSASSLQRSASARSLSPRRARDEVVACDWKSLHSLVGDMGLLQSQVLRKLRDEQEEQLLQLGSSTASSPVSPRGGCGYQAKSSPEESPVTVESKGAGTPRGARQRSAPPAQRPAAQRSGSVKPKAEAKAESPKKSRAKSAAPAKNRDSPEAQAPKAKAKSKAKAKAKATPEAETTKTSDGEASPKALPQACRCHHFMWNLQGDEIPLERRQKVEDLLQELHTSVAEPLCRHFRMRYDYLLEQHCQERKAGVARRAPKLVNGEERYLTTVRLRVRKHPAKGDPQKEFIGRGAMMAVLLHELAHLRYMNHGQEFMLFLREIFAEAKRRGLFDPQLVNELPSCRPWENLIYQTGGTIDEASLMKVFEPDPTSCATPRSLSPVRAKKSEKTTASPPEKVEDAAKVADKGQLPPPPAISESRPSASTASGDTIPSASSTFEEKTETSIVDTACITIETAADESPSKARKSRVLRPKKTP